MTFKGLDCANYFKDCANFFKHFWGFTRIEEQKIYILKNCCLNDKLKGFVVMDTNTPTTPPNKALLKRNKALMSSLFNLSLTYLFIISLMFIMSIKGFYCIKGICLSLISYLNLFAWGVFL